MKVKWEQIHNYQKLNLKNKTHKQAEQKQNHRYGDHLEGYHWGGGRGRIKEKVQGLGRINRQVQNIQGNVRNSVRYREAKALVCMSHGHELRELIAGGNRGTWWRGAKGGKGEKVGTTVIAQLIQYI